MTEKRFSMKGSTILECGEEITAWDCCDLLNELHEENEQLKQKNKGLQSELHIFKEDVAHSNKIIDKLNDENEQLKSEINMLKTTISRNEGYIDRLTHKGEWR